MQTLNALFDELSAIQASRQLPPVSAWNPSREGRIDIRIARDGTWYHEGDPIQRAPIVRLFSTILRKDPDGYCLVTPAEKLTIEVEDAPFVAVDVEIKGAGAEQELLFITNVDDYVRADAEHPLKLADGAAGPKPYVTVRAGLDALVSRPVYYRLAELCEERDGQFWLVSAGERFRLG